MIGMQYIKNTQEKLKMYSKSDWIQPSPDGSFWIDKAKYDYYQGHALGIAHSFGYMYDYELMLMTTIVRSLPDEAIVVNIGAGTGTSGLAILEARPDLANTTWTVDIRDDDNPFGGLMNERNAFSEHFPGIMPRQIHGDSYEVGMSWNKGWIDFLFIDADHTEAGLTKDIEAWYPKVRKGGFILYHDYNHGFWPGVKPIVDKKMKKDILVAVVDISALYIKS